MELIIQYIQCYWIPFTLGILTGISWGYYVDNKEYLS